MTHPMTTSMPTPNDYRASHLERGGQYDSRLADTPFDSYMTAWEHHHLAGIVRSLFPTANARYLDFACGTGRITATVAPLCQSTVGVDISPSMIQVAREKLPQAAFHLCDLSKEDPEVGSFDLITSFRFFGNAQDELREAVLRSLVKRLAPGGYLVINNHRNPRALHALLDRLAGGNAGSMDLHLPKLKGLLERHGLRIRRLQPIGAWMYRARLMHGFRADDEIATARERRFGHPAFAAWAPDAIVVAQRG
jgi:SAM-dependent methyltransferase